MTQGVETQGDFENGFELSLDDLDLDSHDILENAEDDTRKKQPYKEATIRPPTRQEALLNQDDIFGFDEVFVKEPLSTLYISQEEIRRLKGTNGKKVISTFTGCAGSGTGFCWAGYDELMAVEFVDAARETIAKNYDSYIVNPEQITPLALEVGKELGIDVKLNSKRTVQGKVIPPSVDWAETILKAPSPGDVDKLRYETTIRALRQYGELGKMSIWGDDIRGLCPHAIMEFLGLEPGELDVFEGSPPCKSFSPSGLRERGWAKSGHYSDERHQRTDDLFYEYLRFLEAFRPKTFIAENVTGIGMGNADKEFLIPLVQSFTELGYTVEAKAINSKHYSVPQSRPRMLFQGVRADMYYENGRRATPQWPMRANVQYTLQDALDVAEPFNTEEHLNHVRLDRQKDKEEPYETGRIWQRLPMGGAPENKAYQLVRCHPDAPVPTITATSAGNVPAAGPTHPRECRKFTIPENKALFSFPQDYVFTGTLDQQGERMGRSVPPFLMKQVADTLSSIIDNVATIEGIDSL